MHHHLRAPADAARLYLCIEGVFAVALGCVFTVNVLYQATVVGLSAFELVLVGTVLEVTCFIGETPTGIVADRYGRKLSTVIGCALIGAGLAFGGLVPELWAVLLSQVVWGLGATFVSGAAEAWLVDEVGEERAAPAFIRAARIGQIGAIGGIGLAVGLAAVAGVRLPIVLGGLLLVALAAWLVSAMQEHGFTPAEADPRGALAGMRTTARAGVSLVRSRPALRTAVAVSLIAGLSSEGFDRLYTPHLLDEVHLPALGPLGVAGWFGLIDVVALAIGALALGFAARSLDTGRDSTVLRWLAGLDALGALAVFAFALAGSIVFALATYWAVYLAREVREPLVQGWMNRHVESDVRATVISLSSQANALGQIGGGPAVGLIAALAGVPAALAVSGALAAPAAGLWLREARREEVPLSMAEEPA